MKLLRLLGLGIALASAAFAAAAGRPPLRGTERRTIVHPRRPEGHEIAAGLRGGAGANAGGAAVVPAPVESSGAVRVAVLSGTVRLPPVAVETATSRSPFEERAIAAPVPSTASASPSSAGRSHDPAQG